ncbi:hypothetical protein DPM19_14410 [Actinomadura craniellae]|uniref:CU044_5270 family protein n=1 Tax=Actinomadura craniellae TaxID=2231787 RepID=A0A365H713_9ACTN|nr:hypothetical protein DPM19_14410 [Actinomadura craniellae]
MATGAAVALAVLPDDSAVAPRDGGSGGAPVVALDARTILLTAADRAAAQPDRPGRYWHTVRVGSGAYRVKSPGGDYTIVTRSEQKAWTPFTPGNHGWSGSRDLGAVPATPADEAAWRRAGAPSELTVQVGGRKASGPVRLKPMPVSTRPGEERIERHPLVGGDKVFWLGRNVTMKDLRTLPDTPAALKKWLLRSYAGHGTETTDQKMSSDDWLFTVTTGLIIDMPVTPATRAAAFRMLADLKTVRALGTVKDARGRSGSAVAVTERTPNGTFQHRLIIDPATARPLADERVLIKGAGMSAKLPTGTVVFSTVVLGNGWTDAAPR